VAALLLAACSQAGPPRLSGAEQAIGGQPSGAPASKPVGGSQEAPAAPAAAPGAPAGTAPTRPVEFVISTNPGGGSDIYARFIIGIIEKHGLSPQPFLPVNRDGGAGAVAMQYVDAKKGDPNAVMITLNSYITTPMLQKLPFTTDSFTPLALLALDSFFLWVPSDSPWRTFDDFLRDARQREVTVAGTGSKQEDEILFKLIEMRAGTRPFKYVPFRGGGDVCTALAGSQVEATVNNPSECAPFYPERTRPLAAFLDERSPAYRDLPTAKELGLPITYANMRAVVGAPNVNRDSQRWHIDLLRKVYDSPDWQDFVQKNALEPTFMSGDDFGRFLRDFEQLHKELLAAAGWLE
jgi:tripartite-type tricarboxylate transporter receptor subunit TctC